MIEATLHFPAYNVFGTPVKNVSRCLDTPMNDDATQHWVEHYGKLNLDLNSLGR